MSTVTLKMIAAQQPYPDYQQWWPMGSTFIAMMSQAIVNEWMATTTGEVSMDEPANYTRDYVDVVYGRAARAGLVEIFTQVSPASRIDSGEFDALSYAFFRSAFERLERVESDQLALARARRRFCQRVGKAFYGQLQQHLQLRLPGGVTSASDLALLSGAIDRVGEFLSSQGYLRDHFAFRFDVAAAFRGQAIEQSQVDFLAQLGNGQTAYALYEMGYPAILPSAVYLYHTMGEAQHHSSRTIEDLFEAVGLTARETDDFDPTGYPSELVVELWEIRRPS